MEAFLLTVREKIVATAYEKYTRCVRKSYLIKK